MPECRYTHVTKRARNDNPWQAVVLGEYLGTSADKEQAAEAVAKKQVGTIHSVYIQ